MHIKCYSEKPEEKRLLRRRRLRWKGNIRLDLRQMRSDVVSQDKAAVVNHILFCLSLN